MCEQLRKYVLEECKPGDRLLSERKQMKQQGVNHVVHVLDHETKLLARLIQPSVPDDESPTIPVTFVHFTGRCTLPVDAVRLDGEWGAYLATAHLLELGHREIAFAAPAPGYEWAEDRIQSSNWANGPRGSRCDE